MNRQEKELVVADIKTLLSDSQATFVVDYRGMTVKSLQELRKQLRENAGLLKITKARLMKIATQDIPGSESFRDSLKDQIGLVFAKADVSVVAKKIADYSKTDNSLKIVSGFFESKYMTNNQVLALAALPSRDVLLAMFLGTMQAPASSLVRLLNLSIVRLLYVLKQASEK